MTDHEDIYTMEYIGLVDNDPIPSAIIREHDIVADNDWVRLSILAVIAGCRRARRIVVNARSRESGLYNLQATEEFLHYVLNYPNSIPRLTTRIELHRAILSVGRDSIRKSAQDAQTVVLASGGLDSTASLLWALEGTSEVTALWIDYGQPYAAAEELAIDSICTAAGIDLAKVHINLGAEIAAASETYGHIVPARNMLLVSIAAARFPHAKLAVLSAVADEATVPDKSPRFYAFMSNVLGLTVCTPFSEMTKADILRWWERSHFRLNPLTTVSCYADKGKCGACRACLKRAIAFAAAGIDDREYQTDPLSDDCRIIRDDYLDRWSTFSDRRRNDLIVAVRNMSNRFPTEVRQFVELHDRQSEKPDEDRTSGQPYPRTGLAE